MYYLILDSRGYFYKHNKVLSLFVSRPVFSRRPHTLFEDYQDACRFMNDLKAYGLKGLFVKGYTEEELIRVDEYLKQV